jgi:hypothetical protein
VLSITTWLQRSLSIHSRNCLNSATVVPNVRSSCLASPSAGPTITHTESDFFPTSIPAQRSMTAVIIPLSLLSGEE